jgi:hypothetical protein
MSVKNINKSESCMTGSSFILSKLLMVAISQRNDHKYSDVVLKTENETWKMMSQNLNGSNQYSRHVLPTPFHLTYNVFNACSRIQLFRFTFQKTWFIASIVESQNRFPCEKLRRRKKTRESSWTVWYVPVHVSTVAVTTSIRKENTNRKSTREQNPLVEITNHSLSYSYKNEEQTTHTKYGW